MRRASATLTPIMTMIRYLPCQPHALTVPMIDCIWEGGHHRNQTVSKDKLAQRGWSSPTATSSYRSRRRRHPSTHTSSVFIILVLSLISCSSAPVEAFIGQVIPYGLPGNRVQRICDLNRCPHVPRLPSQQHGHARPIWTFKAGGDNDSRSSGSRISVAPDNKVVPEMVATAPAPGRKMRGKGKGGVIKNKNRDKKPKTDRLRVTSAADLRRLLSEGRSLSDLDVRGDSQEMLERREDEHPVLELLRKRVEARRPPGSHGDGFKIGLAIEGGGMRGCVSAGMIAAIYDLGLMDMFDAVYGSSAGSLVGAYAIAGQEGMPRIGCSVYYDTLTGKGRHFIDRRYVARAMGLGLFGTVVTRWRGLRELFQKWGSPVLKLDYLLRDVVESQRPLDWEGFWNKQSKQPLHVIASGVGSRKPVVMSSRAGHFKTLRELTECMRASMLLPGIAGPMVSLPNVEERLVDSQLYEPIPFKTALEDGCTHVLVVRSRPDGGNLLGKPKLLELLVMRRFFKRKHKDPDSYYYMKGGGHKMLYAESVLTLNNAAAAKEGDDGPFLLPMCLRSSESEIGRLERGRENILEGVRKGYEHAHVLLRRTNMRHPTAALGGRQAALRAFPDSILEEDMDPIVREVLDRRRKEDDAGRPHLSELP